MPGGAKPVRDPSPSSSESERSQDEDLGPPPTEINPYEILSLQKTATADQVKSAYRKAALRHHPDKASPKNKDAAHEKFQEVAFAYAILSDEGRRKRYDTTGSTAESLEADDDFDWLDFFRSQKQAMVTADAIEKIKQEYQGTEDERRDLLQAYEDNEGDMDAVYEIIMCSNVLEDDMRFREIIDQAIRKSEVQEFGKYTKDTKTKRKKRLQRAKAEEAEAMELAEELGVKDKFSGPRSVPKAARRERRKAEKMH